MKVRDNERRTVVQKKQSVADCRMQAIQTKRNEHDKALPWKSNTLLDRRLIGSTQGKNTPHEVSKRKWFTVLKQQLASGALLWHLGHGRNNWIDALASVSLTSFFHCPL